MIVLLTLLTGCLDETVEISGQVTDSQGEDGQPVSDASVTIRDFGGAQFASATTDGDGVFSSTVPMQQMFFLEMEADGFAKTAYAGLSALQEIQVTDGELWLRAEDDLEAIRAEFEGCAPAELGVGGVIEGEVRLYVLQGQETEELPFVTTATVTAYTADGTVSVGCYLDDKGTSDPSMSVTGVTGRFALFNVPSGPMSVLISYTYGGAAPHEDWYTVYVPEGGVVPLYPALATMPQ